MLLYPILGHVVQESNNSGLAVDWPRVTRDTLWKASNTFVGNQDAKLRMTCIEQ